MGLKELLGRDSTSFPWERALLVALALQTRSLLLLLGFWLSQVTHGFPPFVNRLRIMPAHPDWYLAALIQNLAIGLALVWIVRRLAAGWAVPLAAISGALAWLVASTRLASLPVESFALALRLVLETIDAVLLLGALAALLSFLRSRWGVVLASTVAATLCGVLRFLLTFSVWGSPWVDTWRFDLAVDALSGAACGIALLILSVRTWHRAASLYVGAHGLGALSLVYLQVALRFAGWDIADTPALLWTIAGLTACGYLALLSSIPALRTSARLLMSLIALELCALAAAVLTLGRWYWAISLLAASVLILSRALAALVVARASGPGEAQPARLT